MTTIQIVFVVLAFVLFLMGGTSRWWANPTSWPYHAALISAGLASLTFGVWLAPLIFK